MKRIDVNGIGVLVEIFKRKDELTDIEMLKEAGKAIAREVIRRQEYEHRSGNGVNRESDNH